MEVLMGKSSTNGPLSMAMVNNQMVNIYITMEKITIFNR
jgi:hypothetical protein